MMEVEFTTSWGINVFMVIENSGSFAHSIFSHPIHFKVHGLLGVYVCLPMDWECVHTEISDLEIPGVNMDVKISPWIWYEHAKRTFSL